MRGWVGFGLFLEKSLKKIFSEETVMTSPL